MAQELYTFVRDGLAKGESKSSLQAVLRNAGWEEGEINAALEQFADVLFSIPVPKRKPYLSAREAFVYLVLFLCLYISAFSFGSLLFDFINRFVPDPLRQYFGESSLRSVRMAVSSLIVAFPLYLWLSVLTGRIIRHHPEKKGSKVRKWLTYITLFVAAGIIIGDFIALIFNLLGGELTMRFILKIAAVIFIAGTTFGYYLWELRKEEKE